MNVAFDPWIPVVNPAGKRELASLNTVLTEGERFTDLAVRPHERISLMRLFLCIAHAALKGPKNYDEWREVPNRLPEAAWKYLTSWKNSFELYHKEKPWLQVAALKPAKENDGKVFTPLTKIYFELASGEKPTLFDHQGLDDFDRFFDQSQIVLGLISIQNFSTCGLLSQPIWNGNPTPKSAKDAPCITSSMYHVFLVGKNIANTICINICDFEELALLLKNAIQNVDWLGKPVWEQMPKNSADSNSAETFLGRLTPVSRAIRLFKGNSKMLYGEGLRYTTYPNFPQEFNTSIAIRRSKKKEERYLVGAKLGIRPWRQLDAILQHNLPGKISSHAINLSHLDDEPIDIWVGTLLRNPGKQDILDSVESVFHIPSRLRVSEGAASYESEVKKAEAWATRLGWAIEDYRTEIDGGWEARVKVAKDKRKLLSQLHSRATRHFWTTVEKQLPLLMAHIEAIGTEAAIHTREAWRKMLFSATCEAYKAACGQETPRQMRAFVKGWQKLTKERDKPESDSLEIREENDELAS